MLDAPAKDSGLSEKGTPRKTASRVAVAPKLRRDLSEDFAARRSGMPRSNVATAFAEEPEEYVPRRRFSGLRFRLKGGVPRSMLGRVLAGAMILGGCAAFTGVLYGARAMLLRDPRLLIASSSSIQTTGNSHLTRAQLLSIFGGDVDRNILSMPLGERRHELESLPWVERATVMRLLPNKVRVQITERTPVAFVRQGGHIGLVDASGVLLEMSPDAPADQHYSFPVVTGVTADDPDSTRAARMKLYRKFTEDLDSGGAAISRNLSEVDLSSPEDVMALIPSGGSDILVHFGDDDFLARYERFEKNIGDWKAQHANLASVDMRYEREAVLEMKPGTAVAPAEAIAPAASPVTAVKTASGKPQDKRGKAALMVGHPSPVRAKAHLQNAFAVSAKSHGGRAGH